MFENDTNPSPLNPPILGDFEWFGSPRIGGWGAVRHLYHSQDDLVLDPNDDTDFTFDSTPINVFVYPATGEASLEYETTIQGNALTVRVVRGTGVTPGDGTINIRPSGSVFVF